MRKEGKAHARGQTAVRQGIGVLPSIKLCFQKKIFDPGKYEAASPRAAAARGAWKRERCGRCNAGGSSGATGELTDTRGMTLRIGEDNATHETAEGKPPRCSTKSTSSAAAAQVTTSCFVPSSTPTSFHCDEDDADNKFKEGSGSGSGGWEGVQYGKHTHHEPGITLQTPDALVVFQGVKGMEGGEMLAHEGGYRPARSAETAFRLQRREVARAKAKADSYGVHFVHKLFRATFPRARNFSFSRAFSRCRQDAAVKPICH
ncbi:hypothetical protein B0H16DRAFT_1451542 [Mycena metata]|uniref:Uncharacterized protein n=1 Tax=Mycena metata TaxID=1033252 RepID=A0AAD7JV98_9AGAR|nr:hypothetical protein B0H16DRAFT_1451542 [Mycena metata]